VGKNVKKNVKT